MAYPVILDVQRPMRWQRVQLLLRVVIVVVLGVLGLPLGWIFGALYLVLPLVAAAIIAQRGGESFLESAGERIAQFLRWWTAFVAYMAFLTDRIPTRTDELVNVRFEVLPQGRPTVEGALLRLLTSIPGLIVLLVLAWLGSLVWFVAALVVLVSERVPYFALTYLRLVVGLQARLLAYHSSLIDAYPSIVEPTEAASQ